MDEVKKGKREGGTGGGVIVVAKNVTLKTRDSDRHDTVCDIEKERV